MNVFYIPSWYPSDTDPLPGVFFREQALALTRHHPEVNAGISTWGQNDDRLLLWGSDPAGSIKKIFRQPQIPSARRNISEKVTEYFSPAFTWTWKIRHGNMTNIIRANFKNLAAFESSAGRADLIHAHVAFPAGYVAMKLSEITKVPYLLTEHMSPFPFKYFKRKNGEPAGRIMKPYRRSAINIAVSEALSVKMAASGIPRIRVIYNSVDETRFNLPEKEPSSAPFTFFTLGRMVPQKGIDILLRAIELLPGRERFFFKIAGDGPALKTYKKIASDAGIDGHIQWLGMLNRDQVAKEMKNCHAFVLPSRHESMGIVFAEATACGRPVIGTRCGGPEEIIHDNNGLLIRKEDPEALARALQKLMKDYRRYDPEKIREDFMRRFSTRVIADQIMNVYREIIRS